MWNMYIEIRYRGHGQGPDFRLSQTEKNTFDHDPIICQKY